MSLISVIHPTRSRPEISLERILTWLTKSGVEQIDVIISLDSDDPMLDGYYQRYSRFDVRLIINPNKSAIEAINNGALAASNRVQYRKAYVKS